MTEQAKVNKASAIRDYMEANPNAKPPEIAEKTGSNVAYVYSIQQKMRKRTKKKAAASSAPSKGQEALREVITEDQKEIARLKNMLGDQTLLLDMQEAEIERLGTIIRYLEKFVLTATRVEPL